MVSGYSGGMRRRLDLAATLVADPEVLFLDEPTTGLDPRARAELWDVLDTLVGRGVTLLLTTQYLEEAERLADDIIVVDHGRIIAHGDSRSLKREVGGDHIRVVVVDRSRLDDAATHRRRRGRQRSHHRRRCPFGHGADHRRCRRPPRRRPRPEGAAVAVEDLAIAQPTLDDVFLTLTGTACRRRSGGAAAMTVTTVPTSRTRHRARRPARATMRWFHDTWVIARRGLMHMRRQPEALSDATIQPIMFVLLFAYVFGGAIPVIDGNYREFLMGGIFAQTIVFTSFGVALSLANDRKNNAVDRFRSLPIAQGAVLGGHAIANLIKALLPIILMSICG